MSVELNSAQLAAVHYTQGPSLVIAGAGSGKTRVITQKIAHLIQSGLAPERIAAITFTNKAAAEMRERTRKLVGRAAGKVVICTFHALGVRILREDGDRISLKPNFSILSSDDVLGILKEAAGTTDNKAARAMQWQISSWKSAGLNSDGAKAAALASGDPDAVAAALVMQRYEERLLAYQSVDFDDLVNLPLRLLQDHEAVRDKWQRLLGHTLVDEYQDTSATQYALLRLLTGTAARFTCVGDDDQSIYAWRGATLDNLRHLPQDYPQLQVIKLEQNYRSVNSVLRAANSVIRSNPKLFEKTLWSELGEGQPVQVLACDHEEHEADCVVQHIQRLQRQGEAAFLEGRAARRPLWSDYAVLYRANHLAKVFEQALRKANIPYKVSGGQSFFERAEIRDLCAWLRLLSNPDDDPAFIRAITTPKRGIGHTSLGRLGELAQRSQVSMFEGLFSPYLDDTLQARAIASLHEFGRQVQELQDAASRTIGQAEARAFLQQWLKDIQYEAHIYDTADHETQAAQRWENVQDFIDWMAKRCGGSANEEEGYDPLEAPAKSMLEVIQTVSLLSTLSEREGERNEVTLSTLHAAKGLEWPSVVLAGVAEGILPFDRDGGLADAAEAEAEGDGDGDDLPQDLADRLAEERRLMYVGITRAQRHLLVTWPKSRKSGRNRVGNQASRFIAEMQLDSTQPKIDPQAELRALRARLVQQLQQKDQPAPGGSA